MKYLVNRQNGFYDDLPRVEIALGVDEASPGMLVPEFDQEGEYDDALEAVEAAIALADAAPRGNGSAWDITISAAASIGMYPTHADGRSDRELRDWADRRRQIDERDRPDDEFDAWDGMTIEEDEE